MRILLTLLVCVGFWACSTKQETPQDAKIIIKGEITDTILLNLYEYRPLGKKNFTKYVLDATEKSENVLEIPDSICKRRLYLSFNETFTFVELEYGQELTIHVDGTQMTFSGDKSKVNQYLYDWNNDYILNFSNAYSYRLAMKNFFSKKKIAAPTAEVLEESVQKTNGLSDKALKDLEKYGVKNKDFVKRQKVFIKYLEECILLGNYAQLKSKKQPLGASLKKQLEEIRFSDVDLLEHPDARMMLSIYFNMQEDLGKTEALIPRLLASRVEKLEQEELREAYLFEELERLVKGERTFMLDAIFENVAPLVKSELGKQQLDSLRALSIPLMAREKRGEDAFEFAIEDAKGKTVRMSDFKGQYVFIDIWATWCGPCKINIPYVNMLEEELKDENIAFVSISVDKPADKQKWLDFIKGTHLGGTSLMAENAFKSELCKFYGVNSIPRFILVDPDGKIVSANCRQPMDSNFRAYLIDFIKNK